MGEGNEGVGGEGGVWMRLGWDAAKGAFACPVAVAEGVGMVAGMAGLAVGRAGSRVRLA
jgi:hypothetical protein